MLPPRLSPDPVSCQFEARCLSLFRQFELLGKGMLNSLALALGLETDRGALAKLMVRGGAKSRASSVEELASRGLTSAGEDTNTSLFLLKYSSGENRGAHTDVDLLSTANRNINAKMFWNFLLKMQR